MMRLRQQIHDEWLVLRCQGGDVAALNDLVGRWRERLMNHARLLLGNHADAADALQEAFIAVARSIRRLDDPALFGPWARRILAHKCADAIRRKQHQRRVIANVTARMPRGGDRPLPADDSAAKVAEDEELARVRLALDQLPIESRALLAMRYARDMSTQAMAAALNIREGTVKSRLHQARNELKAILERNNR